jgi:hypothetical protein
MLLFETLNFEVFSTLARAGLSPAEDTLSVEPAFSAGTLI